MESNLLGLLIIATLTAGQNYEVAEIDCAVGLGGKELLTARLRRPDGFRGRPIFADDRGSETNVPVGSPQLPDHLQRLANSASDESPCQIYPDPLDVSGRVFVLKVTDFSQCGVLKRDGFINVRVWFPQLAGVVMLSDQEVIIMCKPPQPTVTQSKAAGFAGTIPQGARVSGIVEERPGQLEYEVALFRETSSSSGGRSVVSGQGATAFLTGLDSQELPVDQAVPIGTRLQLRAKISPNSAWHHAKLMEVAVSPDPKNPNAHGSVALVKNGCRNPDLSSIIPKQPYRQHERSNEVLLDFEAFLLSNMGERNTLWLHTQIKACMEPADCQSEVCIMDIYQPSSFGRRRRSAETSPASVMSGLGAHNESVHAFMSPLAKRWTTFEGGASQEADKPVSVERALKKLEEIPGERGNRKFGDNIGFSVIMPPDYYRKTKVAGRGEECRGWALGSLISLSLAICSSLAACILASKLRRLGAKQLYSADEPRFDHKPAKHVEATRHHQAPSPHSHHHHPEPLDKTGRGEYARDPSIYRP